MAKTLSFTDTSPQTVKIGDTTTSFTLVCGNDNVATDLTNVTSITVKLGNTSGYLKSATVDPTSLTDPTTGQVTVNFNADLMNSLPAGSYALEVWVVDSTGTSIYPSDGSTGFTITNNIQSANGSTITTITFDDFVQAMNKAASTIAKGDKGDRGPAGDYIPETFTNLAAIQSKYPNGSNGIMIAADNGHKYIWANNTWIDAGVYQAVGVADESILRTKLNVASVFDYETAFKYPVTSITKNNCAIAYNDRKLVVTPTDATRWWGFGVDTDVIVVDLANWGSQLIISENATHYLSLALTGGNTGYFYKLSKTDTTFVTSEFAEKLTFDLTGYTNIMCIRDNGLIKLYKYNGKWEFVADINVTSYFSGVFSNIVFGTSKNTTPVLDCLFYIPDRNLKEVMYTKIESSTETLQAQINALSGDTGSLYPWSGETAYIIGDSISDFDLYQPFLKNYLKLAGYVNFTQSGAPLCNVIERTDLLNKTDALLAYWTANSISPKLVLIWGGTNDFGMSCPLGTIESDTTYTLGALRRIIDKINTAHPKCTIIGVTPMQRNATNGNDLAGMGPNAQGLYLKDYSDGIKSVFEANGVPVIDMYKNSGINVYNVNNTDILRDGLHPAASFNPRIAFMFAKFISNYTKIV